MYVDRPIATLLRAARLEQAAAVPARAAGGAPIKFAFVDVPDAELNAFRDQVSSGLDLGDRGSLIIAIPVSVGLHTKTLHPQTEVAMIARDGEAIGRMPRRYTEPLAELVYDVGRVIHNSTPGVEPHGDGVERHLRTFDGTFRDEEREALPPWAGSVAALVAVVAVASALTIRRRPRGS